MSPSSRADTREADVLSLDEDASPPYADGFLDFINKATTVYHSVDYMKTELEAVGYRELKEREDWISQLRLGGKYFVTRNGSSIISFAVGNKYTAGNGFAMIASHMDALCWKLKPVSKDSKGGFDRLAAAPYSGGGASERWDGDYSTWWDRDLALGGRVLVKRDGKVVPRLVKLPNPVARIPSLAAHFGAPALGPFNYETNMVPIIGLHADVGEEEAVKGALGKQHSSRLLKAVAKEIGVSVSDIVDIELELHDAHPAAFLGLSSEFISAPRLDDKLCSFSALSALLAATTDESFLAQSGLIHLVGLFDLEEIGSGLRQGAKSNFLQVVIERIVEAQLGLEDADKTQYIANLSGQSMARSFLISADVSHAYNPNFDGVYITDGSPALNKGIVIECDPNGHVTTNAPSIALCRTIADLSGCELQHFQIRNDSRSGGTVGPMLSERLGVPAVDVGIPMLSMHSIRGLTGSKDPGLGVKFFESFFRHYESLESIID